MFIDNPFKEVRMYCHVEPFYLNSQSVLRCLCVFFCSQTGKDPVEHLPCSLDILIIWSSVLNSGKDKIDYSFLGSWCLSNSILGNGNQVSSRFEMRASSLLFLCFSGSVFSTSTRCCWFKVLYFDQWTCFSFNLYIHKLLSW